MIRVGETGDSSGRNRLRPNRPSSVCAINRLVLTTSAARRDEGVEFAHVARESIGSHKHPLYNRPLPHGKLISIPHLRPLPRSTYDYLCKCGPVLCE